MQNQIKSAKRIVQPDSKLSAGVHIATITDFILKPSEAYNYVDFSFETDKGEKSKVGFNDFVSPSSQLGKFLNTLGINIEAGLTVDFSEAIGKQFKFSAVKNAKGYVDVIKTSIEAMDSKEV